MNHWIIKSVITRANFSDSKKRAATQTTNPVSGFVTPYINDSTQPYMQDVYVRLPLNAGFPQLDTATKQQIVNALVTPDTFRELFAPDLSEAEWNWLPDHALETIMRFRWIKQNLRSMSLYEDGHWAILQPRSCIWYGEEDESESDKKKFEEKWNKMISIVECDSVRIGFSSDSKNNLWLHTYMPDVLRHNFDLETVRKQYEKEQEEWKKRDRKHEATKQEKLKRERQPQDEEPQDEEPQDEEPQDEEPQDEEPQDEEPVAKKGKIQNETSE